MTEEEKRFLDVWGRQRLRKKQYLRRFSLGLPLGALLAVGVLANLLSGWYKRADAAMHADTSVIIVVVIALVLTVVFITIFSAHHKWDRNEAVYQELLEKKRKEEEGGSADLK